MRKQLVCKLQDFQTPGDWDHVVKQCGMFSYTGLTGKATSNMFRICTEFNRRVLPTEKQVSMLIKDWHIYLLKSGRMNICALNTNNIDYVAEAMSKVVRGERNEDSGKMQGKGDCC